MNKEKRGKSRTNNRSNSSDQFNQSRKAIPPGMFPDKPDRDPTSVIPLKNEPQSPINDRSPSEKPSSSDKK